MLREPAALVGREGRNLIITPHTSGNGDNNGERLWVVMREILRRYVAGGKMFNVVDVNQEAAEDQMKVKSGDELAVLPPFAGGAETAADVDQLVRVQEGPFDVNAEIELVKRISAEDKSNLRGMKGMVGYRNWWPWIWGGLALAALSVLLAVITIAG